MHKLFYWYNVLSRVWFKPGPFFFRSTAQDEPCRFLICFLYLADFGSPIHFSPISYAYRFRSLADFRYFNILISSVCGYASAHLRPIAQEFYTFSSLCRFAGKIDWHAPEFTAFQVLYLNGVKQISQDTCAGVGQFLAPTHFLARPVGHDGFRPSSQWRWIPNEGQRRQSNSDPNDAEIRW